MIPWRRRKQPRQERSSKVVDRILDAALILTREQGTKTPTTLAIAQRAGLSVGSLGPITVKRDSVVDAVTEKRDVTVRSAVSPDEAGLLFGTDACENRCADDTGTQCIIVKRGNVRAGHRGADNDLLDSVHLPAFVRGPSGSG